MEFTDVVRRRRMVRNYDPDRSVPPELISGLLDLAVRAPSAGFSQGWAFLVLDTPEDRDRFWAATSPDAEEDASLLPPAAVGRPQWITGMMRAPVLVVAHSSRDVYLDRYAEVDKGWTDRSETRWPVPYWHIDTGMAAMIFLLAAQDEGLAACFFGVPPDRWAALFEAFDVPDGLAPVGVVSVGYPAPDVRSPSLKRGRRPLAEVVRYGSFGSPA
jgi:nitroreductase